MPDSEPSVVAKSPLIGMEIAGNGCWEVYVKLWGGQIDLCRRTFISEWQAQRAHGELLRKLAACEGDVLKALSDWCGRPVLMPLLATEP